MPEIPEGAKTPTDRKSKAAEPKVAKVEVLGVAIEIEPETLDDFTFLEDMAIADGGDEDAMFAAIRVLRRLAGDQYRELRAAAEKDAGVEGRLSVEKGAEILLPLIQKILEAAAPNS